jgi:fumarate reductase subunit D
MTTDDDRRPRRRTSSWFWVLFFAGTVVLVFLAVLPILATFFVAAVWGAGCSGSNK